MSCGTGRSPFPTHPSLFLAPRFRFLPYVLPLPQQSYPLSRRRPGGGPKYKRVLGCQLHPPVGVSHNNLCQSRASRCTRIRRRVPFRCQRIQGRQARKEDSNGLKHPAKDHLARSNSLLLSRIPISLCKSPASRSNRRRDRMRFTSSTNPSRTNGEGRAERCKTVRRRTAARSSLGENRQQVFQAISNQWNPNPVLDSRFSGVRIQDYSGPTGFLPRVKLQCSHAPGLYPVNDRNFGPTVDPLENTWFLISL